MSNAAWGAALIYIIIVLIFLGVGFRSTKYHWSLIIVISLFWLPMSILAWFVSLFRTRPADAAFAYDRKNIRAEQSRDFWRYVPAISKPFNPAYQRVWHSMSHRERQKSFLIDVGVIASVGLLAWWFA